MDRYWLNEKKGKASQSQSTVLDSDLKILTGDKRKEYLSVINDRDDVEKSYSLFTQDRIDKAKDLHGKDALNWAGSAITDFYNQFELYSTYLAKVFNTVYQTNNGRTEVSNKLTYHQLINVVKSVDAMNYLFSKQIKLFIESKFIESELNSEDRKKYEMMINVAKLMQDIVKKSFMNLFNHLDTDFNSEFNNWNLAIYQLGIMSLNRAEFKIKYGKSKSKVLKEYPELIDY